MVIPKPTRDPLPEKGRLAGIDYGTVRIGVAITDPERKFVSPYENYSRKNPNLDAKFFREIVANERIVGWVVGLPTHLDGNESQKSYEARQFAEWLKKETNLPYDFGDERYTSYFAEEILREVKMTRKKTKQRLDMLAAQMMLQGYLDTQDKQGSTQGLGN